MIGDHPIARVLGNWPAGRRWDSACSCRQRWPWSWWPWSRSKGTGVQPRRGTIGRGQRLLGALFGELKEASDNRDEIEEAF